MSGKERAKKTSARVASYLGPPDRIDIYFLFYFRSDSSYHALHLASKKWPGNFTDPEKICLEKKDKVMIRINGKLWLGDFVGKGTFLCMH